MKIIKTIVNKLKNNTNNIESFVIMNNETKQNWCYSFEIITEDEKESILMRVNNSSLTQEWFDNIKHLEFFLNMTDLTDKKYITI
jgi:hypothetical protein